jgi:hypothetical protein
MIASRLGVKPGLGPLENGQLSDKAVIRGKSPLQNPGQAPHERADRARWLADGIRILG